MLPERLTKPSAEAEEEAEEREKLMNVARDYTMNLDRNRQKVNDIFKTHT